jgi:hypothetical protein
MRSKHSKEFGEVQPLVRSSFECSIVQVESVYVDYRSGFWGRPGVDERAVI